MNRLVKSIKRKAEFEHVPENKKTAAEIAQNIPEQMQPYIPEDDEKEPEFFWQCLKTPTIIKIGKYGMYDNDRGKESFWLDYWLWRNKFNLKERDKFIEFINHSIVCYTTWEMVERNIYGYFFLYCRWLYSHPRTHGNFPCKPLSPRKKKKQNKI